MEQTSVRSSVIFNFKTIEWEELDSSNPSVTEKIREAMKDGFFYLKGPQDCLEWISEAVRFAETFSQRQDVREIKLSGFGGYRDRESLQLESFYAERCDWLRLKEEGVYSEKIYQLGLRMQEVGLKVLKSVLQAMDIPEPKWNELTGNLTRNEGLNHFTFNHFRAARDFSGQKEHKDFGYLTVLFNQQVGLEGFLDGAWRDIPPPKEGFLINFGRCMEMITQGRGETSAIMHRVRKVFQDRISFGIFMDGDRSTPLYSYNRDSQTTKLEFETHGEYLDQQFNKYHNAPKQ